MRYLSIKTNDATFNASRLAFGTHNFGTAKCPDFRESSRLLDCYIEGGGNIIDSGRCYGGGESERHIGEWLKRDPSVRKSIIISTKGGQREVAYYPKLTLKENEMYEDLMVSLDLLNTDYIDFYFLHKDDRETPVGEIVEYMNKFKNQGLIRAIGVSNWKADRINEANEYAEKHGLCGIEISQLMFSAYDFGGAGSKEYMVEMARNDYDYYKKSKIPVMGYNSQVHGFYYKNFDKADAEITASEKNIQKLNIIRRICKERGLSPQEVIFGFFSGLDIDAIPLATSTSLEHLKTMLASCEVSLGKDEIKELLF